MPPELQGQINQNAWVALCSACKVGEAVNLCDLMLVLLDSQSMKSEIAWPVGWSHLSASLRAAFVFSVVIQWWLTS